jgi:hypothetical protein
MHGGNRDGAGRKPKDKEDRIRDLSINALNEIFGSEQAAINHIAEQAKSSFPHLKLLLEYAYGKPKDTIEIESKELETTIIKWGDGEIAI